MHRTLRHLASGASALAATLLLSTPAAQAAVSIHPGTDSSKKLIITVNMPPAGTRATVLVRCAVPNAIAGEAAGVIGYRVSH